MTCVSALSTARNTSAAMSEVVERVAAGLGGTVADVALVFASPHHGDALGRTAADLLDRGLTRHVIGCTGETIVGDGEEVEGRAALVVWAASLPGMTVATHRPTIDGGRLTGWGLAPPSGGAAGPRPTAILLADPFSFPVERFLRDLRESDPGVRVVGGMASAAQTPGGNRLVVGGQAYSEGAVSVTLDGLVGPRTVVSQGCRPIGRPLVVTRVEGNVLRDLGRRPAMEVLGEMFEGLPPEDQRLMQQGLHVGRVINEYQESFQRGDFLVRNVLGADEAGGLAVTDLVRVGQTVQFHVRDADSAHADLLSMLEAERSARPDAKVEGALLFSCNGRGTRLFSGPNHDAGLVRRVFGPVPVAGFFAMGEIGPVGGQNFVHGFTASIVLFEGPTPPTV